MVIAISGSSGFIGKALVNRLIKTEGIELILIDKDNNIDMLDKFQLDEIKPFDIFIHLAGISFVPDSFVDPVKFYEINYLTTLNALELCRKNSARMIFMSSYVYGHPEYLPIDEKHPIKAFNPYAQTKILGEKLCEGYYRDFEVPSTIFRLFNVYGEGQNTSFLIPLIFSELLKGNTTIKLKDKRPKRDYIHIEDVVSAIELSVFKKNKEYYIFNLATGKSHSVYELTQIISNLIPNKSVEFVFDNSIIRKNEVLNTIGNNEKIMKTLGWVANIDLKEGLKRLVAELG